MLHCLKAGNTNGDKRFTSRSVTAKKIQTLTCTNGNRSFLTVVQQVCDVQTQRGQDGVKHFEVLSEARHEQQEAGGSLEEGSTRDVMVRVKFHQIEATQNLGARLGYLDKLEAGVEEGGLQQRLDAGDPHPSGRRGGAGDGGLDRGEGQGRGGGGREGRREELVEVTLLRLLGHRSDGQKQRLLTTESSGSRLSLSL